MFIYPSPLNPGILRPFMFGILMLFSIAGFAQTEKPVESRTITKKIEDSSITFRLSNLIARQTPELGADTQVNVTTVNGVVLLTGSVESAQAKEQVESLVEEHPYVRKVVNEIRVEKSRSPLVLGRDKILQMSVKHRISRELKKNSPTVHVVVYRKTVYLMGVVSEEVAEQAAKIAQNTRRSERVITVFELKTVEESQT
ncbi:MAG: BON domain-containing protein [Acidiferrobacterales bacterium]|nr:BON domain-containing protein [Acidiferrobacterales bacterium]